MKKFTVLLFLILFLLPVFPQQKTFDDYYMQAKENIIKIQERVNELESTVVLREDDIKKLQEDVDRLVIQVDKDTEEIAEKGQKIIEQNEKLKIQRKWLIILISMFATFILAHIAILIIKLKWNIKLPYWLNAII